MSHPSVNLILPRRLCTSPSTTLTPYLTARKLLVACRKEMYTEWKAAPLVFGRGAKGLSTPKIAGKIRCASSRPERFILASRRDRERQRAVDSTGEEWGGSANRTMQRF